ncbi:MAG: hypothetical protein ACYDB7_02730 [Mycobacteriales bacterium]
MTLAVTVVAVVALLACWVTWLAGRLDRLAQRCEAAWLTLDAQLVRRSATAQAYALAAGDDELAAATGAVLAPPVRDGPDRERLENRVSRALRATVVPEHDPLAVELVAAAGRLALARAFHNDAVRDLRSLRGHPVVRLLRLGAARQQPSFFEFDDVAVPRSAAVESR